MPLRVKCILAFLILTIPTLVVGLLSVSLLARISAPLHTIIPEQIEKLASLSSLNQKALYIKYYDEVLTQSARNYAFTGDIKWQIRYNQEVPMLDTVIKEAIAEGDNQDRQTFANIDEANLALIELETKAMKLVDSKDLVQAQKLLDSQEYSKQKAIYSAGLTSYTQRRGVELNSALSDSSLTLRTISNRTASLSTTSMVQLGIVTVAMLAVSIGFALWFSRMLIMPLIAIRNKAQDIAQGNFTDQLDISSKDEIGELAKAFNQMTQELKKSKENVEEQVAQRTKELEKLNRFMVARELKMAELKERLHENK